MKPKLLWKCSSDICKVPEAARRFENDGDGGGKAAALVGGKAAALVPLCRRGRCRWWQDAVTAAMGMTSLLTGVFFILKPCSLW